MDGPAGPSLFLYGSLDRAIGGPAFFFVRGLSAGFGYNRRLNAIIIECLEYAREAAEAADAARARGADAPLLGLPITLKESINVRGLPTTAGLPAFAQTQADFDAAVDDGVGHESREDVADALLLERRHHVVDGDGSDRGEDQR